MTTTYSDEKTKGILYALQPRIDRVLVRTLQQIQAGQTESFLVHDMQTVRERVNLWRQYLPNVDIHYAVKANTDIRILQEMINL